MRLLVLLLLYVLLLLFVFLNQLLRLLLMPLFHLLHPRVVGLLAFQLAVILLLPLLEPLVILLLPRVQLFLLLLVFPVSVRITCVGCRWARVSRQFVGMDCTAYLPAGTPLLRRPVEMSALLGGNRSMF